MEKVNALLLCIGITFLFSNCKSPYNTVIFSYERTPKNKIVLDSNLKYRPIVHLDYINKYKEKKEEFDKEVVRLTKEYEKDLEKYEQANVLEKLGMKKPKLELPDEPVEPYYYNSSVLENRVQINGMQRIDTDDGLLVNLHLEGFSYYDVLTMSNKKATKDVATDTSYYSNAKVKHPIRLEIVSPNGSVFQDKLEKSRIPKKLTTVNYRYKEEAESGIYDLIKEEEKIIVKNNIESVNELLNDELGTQTVQYSIEIYTPTSKKYNYDDLQEAAQKAELGLELLHSNPKASQENLKIAADIWREAIATGSNDKTARINTNVQHGLYNNLLIVSLFCENWELAATYKSILNAREIPKSSTHGVTFSKSLEIYSDLKERYNLLRDE